MVLNIQGNSEIFELLLADVATYVYRVGCDIL